MTSRLQILKNGQHVATIGIEGAGVSSVTLGTAEKAEGESHCDLTVGVLTFPESPTERQRWMSWPMPHISEGDEITVRILPPGTCDPPDESTGGEEKVIDDPEFGRLSYLIDGTGMVTSNSPADQFEPHTFTSAAMNRALQMNNASSFATLHLYTIGSGRKFERLSSAATSKSRRQMKWNDE